MDPAPFDPGHLPDCHRVVLHSCKRIPCAVEAKNRGGMSWVVPGYVCLGVAPLDAGVLALPVIPRLKIMDRGLVDVGKHEIVDMIRE